MKNIVTLFFLIFLQIFCHRVYSEEVNKQYKLSIKSEGPCYLEVNVTGTNYTNGRVIFNDTQFFSDWQNYNIITKTKDNTLEIENDNRVRKLVEGVHPDSKIQLRVVHNSTVWIVSDWFGKTTKGATFEISCSPACHTPTQPPPPGSKKNSGSGKYSSKLLIYINVVLIAVMYFFCF